MTARSHQPARNAVVLAADQRIFPAAIFAAERLAALNHRSDTDIIVFTDCAAECDKANALSLPFDVRLVETPRGVAEASYYLRFTILDAIARDYRRILYVDVDMWFEDQRLFALFDLDMEGHAFAAVRDGVIAYTPGPPECATVLGPGKTKYLNAGLLLVDAAGYRSAKVSAKLKRLIRDPGRRLFYRDQSALNLLLGGNWLELSPCFNILAVQWNTFVTRVCPPVVVHFTGASKPWQGPHFTLDHPARAAMERWFPGSAWKDFLPRFVDLSRVLDPLQARRQANFDMEFSGKADYVRFLRETRFADEKAGLTALYRDRLPPA